MNSEKNGLQKPFAVGFSNLADLEGFMTGAFESLNFERKNFPLFEMLEMLSYWPGPGNLRFLLVVKAVYKKKLVFILKEET